MDLKNRDTQFMILAGIRYGIGRRSYAPGLITDWVRAHWAEFPAELKVLIKRDIADEIRMWNRCPDRSLGDSCDIRTWRGFTEWLDGED